MNYLAKIAQEEEAFKKDYENLLSEVKRILECDEGDFPVLFDHLVTQQRMIQDLKRKIRLLEEILPWIDTPIGCDGDETKQKEAAGKICSFCSKWERTIEDMPLDVYGTQRFKVLPKNVPEFSKRLIVCHSPNYIVYGDRLLVLFDLNESKPKLEKEFACILAREKEHTKKSRVEQKKPRNLKIYSLAKSGRLSNKEIAGMFKMKPRQVYNIIRTVEADIASLFPKNLFEKKLGATCKACKDLNTGKCLVCNAFKPFIDPPIHGSIGIPYEEDRSTDQNFRKTRKSLKTS